MGERLYTDSKTGKLVHAKPSIHPGIIIWYYDKNGKPTGRCMAATLEEFNDRFKPVPKRAASNISQMKRAA